MADQSNDPENLSAERETMAQIADLSLRIAREIQFRGYRDPTAQRLTTSEATIMRHLAATAPATPTELVAATGLQRTNLSTTLRGLESKNLIQRVPDPEDARSIAISLTSEGRRNYTVVKSEWADVIEQATGHDPISLQAALRVLTAVVDTLVDTRPAVAGGIPNTA